jgi:beta-galactosidase
MMLSLCLTALALALAVGIAQAAPREKYNFNPGWLLLAGDAPGVEAVDFNDHDWKKITLPRAWNEDEAFRKSIDELPTGIAWYRKRFALPADAKDRKVFLEFEGIRQGGEFYLNGEWIGRSANGVMAFGFDVTGKIKFGEENVIAARIDSSWKYRDPDSNAPFQWNDKNFYADYGGINKHVYLHLTDRLHQTLPLYSNLGTTGTYVYASDIDVSKRTAKVTVETQVRNDDSKPREFQFTAEIHDPQGKVVAKLDGGRHALASGQTETLSSSTTASDLHFWSWGYGYLYDVVTTLSENGKPVDVVTTRTGFRKTEFEHGVVKLNDRVIQLKGYAQRTTNEWPAVGSSVPAWMSDFSNALMVESGANVVRWMHVTPWKQDVESCDRVGLMQALPAGDSERDVEGERWNARINVMRDAIVYNRNNPSVLFYECGNAGISEAHMAEMKALRDQYDPHGGRAIGSREMLDSKVAEYGGEMLYLNKSARIPVWAMEYSRDEGLRKYWDDWSPPFHKDGDGPPHKGKPAPEYNRNQDSHAIENVVRWYDYWRERPGTGERVNSGGVNIVFSDSNTHHRGAENYRRSGEVDAMRLPKDGFFAHQVMWDGWVDVEKPRVHLLGHWNYETDVRKPVYAISSADKVELFVNGKSKGFGERSSQFLFTWKDVAFEPGKIRAVGANSGGKQICEAQLETAGQAVALRLTPQEGPGGWKADGADMALVDVEVIDAQGRRCPTALNPVAFSLTGPAEWRGGIAQAPDNGILVTTLPVECGVNRVILRSTSEAGTIALDASTPGLKSARIELATKPFPTTNGLSPILPGQGLPGRLTRGPTPVETSVKPTRVPVRIASAKAGANAETASHAFDDNEKTSWQNDKRQETGWIEFELGRPALVSEVTLKVGGWRARRYPIRILVGGQEVFSGVTPPSLGYVTLPVKPTRGNAVRIELTGGVQERDGFGLVEVTGKKLEDAQAGRISDATLEIVEAEIYEPLPAR